MSSPGCGTSACPTPATPRRSSPPSTTTPRRLDSYREKVDGDFIKTKCRLRWYDPELSADPALRTAFLEIKRKIGQGRRKTRVRVDVDRGRLDNAGLDDPLFAEILASHAASLQEWLPAGLLPAAVVEYRRRRFICPFTLSRVCLDTAIGLGRINERLLPRLGQKTVGTIVLEIKDGGRARIPWLGDAPRRRDPAAQFLEIRRLHRGPAQGGVIVFDQIQRIKDVQDLTASIDPLALRHRDPRLPRPRPWRPAGSTPGSTSAGGPAARSTAPSPCSASRSPRCSSASRSRCPLSLGLLGALSIIRFRTPDQGARGGRVHHARHRGVDHLRDVQLPVPALSLRHRRGRPLGDRLGRGARAAAVATASSW